jgi:outer membrane receptor for ferric coprogen and ferric-rhodotorulic acid
LNENFYQLAIIPLTVGRGQRRNVLRRLIMLHPGFRSGIFRKKQFLSFANYYQLGEGVS